MAIRGYVSNIGFQLVQPMLDLVEKLASGKVGYPNEVQTSPWENGYATSIVVLSALVLESAANRVRYLRKGPVGNPAPDYLRTLLGDESGDHIDEVFVVRDVIVHNHMWEGQIDDVEGELRFCGDPVLVVGRQRNRYLRSVDGNARATKRLHLNLIPSRVWRKDVLEVLKVLVDVLMKLEQIDRSYYQTASQAFTFRGKYVSIQTAVQQINLDRLGIE